MKALILCERQEASSDLRTVLRASGHTVHAATNVTSSLEEIKTEAPDITFIWWDPSTSVLPTVAQSVRAHDDLTRACRFVVAVLEDDAPGHRTASYEAGADEIARASATPRELVGLVRLAERIVRLEQRLHARVVELESALRRLELAAVRRGQALAAVLPASGATGSFLLSAAWTKVEDVLTMMCNDYLGGGFSLVARAGLPGSSSQGASITLTDVGRELQVEMFFCAAEASARAIAAAFCGDLELVDDDMVRDVLLELANSGMGAVKGAFSAEKFGFVGAIPKNSTMEVAAKWLEQADAKRVLAFHSDKATVHVLVGVRHIPRIRVQATALREGMVIATDVTNDGGVLIARAGTRLTETTAERIARLVPKKQVELADAG